MVTGGKLFLETFIPNPFLRFLPFLFYSKNLSSFIGPQFEFSYRLTKNSKEPEMAHLNLYSIGYFLDHYIIFYF